MREKFEAWCREKYACSDHSFTRTRSGVYVHTVGHRSERMTYAAVQMLWEAWRDSQVQGATAVGEQK